MIDVSLSAGVDVGSTWLDLGFHPFARPIRARNSDSGVETIVAALRLRGVGKVALEAIGGYARKLVAALIEADLKVFVVNPRRIKAFRDAEGLIAKTDKLDAGLIARFAHAMAHELRPLPDAEQAILKALSTRRRQLTESIAIEKTRLKQAFDPLIVESCREMIAILEDTRRVIEADLDRRIDAQDRMARRRAILSSIPGVGAHISALVVVEMPELGAIDRKAAASLAGLAPHPSQSGLSRGRNAISGGRPCVRAAFYMAALVATRSHPKFKQAYLDLRAAGKPAKVALVAIARRLVTLANALIRNDMTFENAAFAATS
jgi:transposase